VKNILLFIVISAGTLLSQQTSVVCRTTGDVVQALTNFSPGMQIILEDGEYRFDSPVTISAGGTKARPAVIKARHRNKAVIAGATALRLRSVSYVTVEGLVFANDGSSAILLEGCNNIRITRNVFRLNERGRGSWVMVTGNPADSLTLSHHNRIDHNLFEKKKELGNFITVEGTLTQSPAVSQYDVIEKNHFRSIGPRVENVLEAIRLGSAQYTLSRGHTVLQNNLFERCDGDPEYISIKLSDCSILKNTFVECLGSLSLRHGNHSTVSGNVIIGNNRTGSFLDSTGKTWTLGTGGIRFCADSMTITGNYCEGLTGSGWDATVAATNGDADYGEGKPLTKHFRITNALVADNIFVNNVSGIEIGFDGAGFQANWWKKVPDRMVFRNNIIAGTADTLVKMLDVPTNTRFENNIVFPSGKAVASAQPIQGLLIKDPGLVRRKGLLLPRTGALSKLSIRQLTSADVGPDAQ
jgi:poly(beta-D-mannuronate) lyase